MGIVLKFMDEDAQITVYELKDVLEKAVKAIDNLPYGGLIAKIDESEQLALDRLAVAVKKVNNHIVDFEKQIAEADQQMYEAAEQYFEKTSKCVANLNRRISQLPNIAEIGAPYSIEKLIGIATQCSDLTDEQWQRVIDLAHAFKKEVAQ